MTLTTLALSDRSDRAVLVRPVFVEVVPGPALMEDGVLYISIAYATAIHKCACGCDRQAVTPLSPEEWSLSYNGEAISLSPSIGNWGMECKSHYWIRDNQVIWARAEKRRGLLALLRSALHCGRGLFRPREIGTEQSQGG